MQTTTSTKTTTNPAPTATSKHITTSLKARPPHPRERTSTNHVAARSATVCHMRPATSGEARASTKNWPQTNISNRSHLAAYGFTHVRRVALPMRWGVRGDAPVAPPKGS